jgi:hypothetical protein
MREAIRALEFSVVIDVAMTETARQADNVFHLRQPLFEPLTGTLHEAEIVARLLEEAGELTERDYRVYAWPLKRV